MCYRQNDRKCLSGTEGRVVRRYVFVRKKNLFAIGKEVKRIEGAKVLGLRVVRGRAKRCVDPDPFKGSAMGVVRRRGVNRMAVFNRRRPRRPPKSSSSGQTFAVSAPKNLGGVILVDNSLIRFILTRYLYKEDVQDLLDELGMPVSGSKQELIQRLLRSRGFELDSALSFLRREELADLCGELGLPPSGSREDLLRRVESVLYG